MYTSALSVSLSGSRFLSLYSTPLFYSNRSLFLNDTPRLIDMLVGRPCCAYSKTYAEGAINHRLGQEYIRPSRETSIEGPVQFIK